MVALMSRANHYEVLGLNPTATDEEIAQAFARQMRLPHPVAELAQIGIAFDTLRTPTKRRSYDERLGLRPEPQSQVAPAAMSFRISARLAALASPAPIEAPPASEPLPTARQRVDAQQTRNEDPSSGSASAPRQAQDARESDEKQSIAAPTHDRESLSRRAATAVRAAPALEDLLQIRGAAADEQGAGWPKSAVALGGLLVTVVLIGAWAGAHAQDSDRPKTESSAPFARPHAKVQPSPPAETAIKDEKSWSVPQAAIPAKRAGSTHSSVHMALSEPRLASISQTLVTPGDDAAAIDASDVTDSQSAADSSLEASLPLSRAVIARTIERIGYRCGEVASATAVEPSGVYKITCTSGQAYQAKPVRGRYHFKRW